MKYCVNVVARNYLKGYYKFLVENGCVFSSVVSYKLFMHCIRVLYGFESSEWSEEIRKYSKRCIKYLRELGGVPRYPSKMSLEKRRGIVDLCDVYAVSTDLLTYKRLLDEKDLNCEVIDDGEDGEESL